MINKRNKRNLNKDKIRNTRKKSKFFSERQFKKKNWNEIKVVSTNVLKDKDKDKDFKEKKDKKNNYNSSSQSNYKRISRVSENKNDKNIKTKNFTKSTIDKKTVLNNHYIQYKINKIEKKNCAKCNKKIEEMDSSIKDSKKELYYHFNCVMDEIKKDNVVEGKQRIVYLGSGTFGIIEDIGPDLNNHKFIIKKKIQYIDNS